MGIDTFALYNGHVTDYPIHAEKFLGQTQTRLTMMTQISPSASKSVFGVTAEGHEATLYTLRNRAGLEVKITNYGGIVTSLKAPDREGVIEDIVLGFDTLAEYEADSPYFGALIGRFGNRICNGKFQLNGQEYRLARNNGPNHLHGGGRGFDKVVWDGHASVIDDQPTLLLRYVSEAGEEGYPGTLTTEVRYTLSNQNELILEYSARSDEDTHVNLTSHSYFNLSGNARRDILTHTLEIYADSITPVDESLIPTGEIRHVSGTPFDFRIAKPVGLDIDQDDEQLGFGGGYDHNWVISLQADGRLRPVATLSDPESGRTMTVQSTEPGVQFYTGNSLDGTLTGKGVKCQKRWGLCLETQHFPDSPNQPDFPTTLLKAGDTYMSKTVHTFGTGSREPKNPR